jgi:hypothetical protein
MKWGVKRSRAERAAAAKKAGTTPKAPAKKPDTDGPETSASRYDRLAGQAKAGKASEMSEADLKFFNARTEALAKVNKLNEEKPGWLAETSRKVIQTTAERQMQSIADSVADKYIGAPIKDAIKGAAK